MVVDAGNNMAGAEVSQLFKRSPAWRLIPMYLEPEGTFPHHIANPLLPSATRDLQDRVTREKARYHRREREAGKFSRIVSLPSQVDTSKVEARCIDGVLTVVLSKAEEAKPKQVAVKTS
jgi:hypothetical protein